MNDTTTNEVAVNTTNVAAVNETQPAKKKEKAPKEKAPKEKAPKEKAPKEVKEKAPSVKSKVIPVVQAAIAAGTARKDTLAALQTEFGISAACAQTYYQNVKSGNWK